MRIKLALAIMVIASVSLSLVGTGCSDKTELKSEMSAVEVCQYVNQALPIGYEKTSSISRYQIRYLAKSAAYVGGEEQIWNVSVQVTKQKQVYKDGVWTIYPPTLSPEVTTKIYVFNEHTGAVTTR